MSKVDKRKIVKGDSVYVISGDDKGKIGRVLKVIVKSFKSVMLVVSGVNIYKVIKKDAAGSRQISQEFPISISNVMYFDALSEKRGRVGFKFVDGKKVRYCKASGGIIS